MLHADPPRVQRWRKQFCLSIFLAACAATSVARADTLFQESFAAGLGQFTSTGTVSTTLGAARMRGSLGSDDGTITSTAINAQGFTDISLSFDRSSTGLDLGEAGIAAVSINGGAFVTLESSRTAAGRATFSLGASAANATRIVLRFSVNASSTLEYYDVDNIVLSGTRGGGNPGGPRPALGEFVTFETGQVRPLALSSNGSRLYAVNTPDNRVEVFDVAGATPTLLESIPVGLEPVAVALANDNELWVVNHLSDSVSVVDVSSRPARVTNTLLVGDEPRDIVFAGPSNGWAFITAAHRGQNAPFDPQLTTAGVGRADVWVFSRNNLGTKLGGAPATILNMFGDTLRGLARTADGSRVYAAVLNSGNRSTVLTDDIGEGGISKHRPSTQPMAHSSPAPA